MSADNQVTTPKATPSVAVVKVPQTNDGTGSRTQSTKND